MKFLAALIVAGVAALTASACPYVTSASTYGGVVAAPVAVAVPVYQAQIVVPQVQAVAVQPVAVQAVYAAPAVVQTYVAPVVHQQVIQRQVVVEKQVVRQKQVVQRANVYGGVGRAGFAGGGLRGAFAPGGGGIAGLAERITGIGDGSGQTANGALLGVLAARSNLFGLGRR